MSALQNCDWDAVREPENPVDDHLAQALASTDPAEKNYHIRSALQALAIERARPRS